MLLAKNFTLNNGQVVKNRLVLAPLTLWSSTEQGILKDEEISFVAQRAQGAGLVITAGMLIASEGKTFQGQPAVTQENFKQLQALAQAIQAQGALGILQLQHGGEKALAPKWQIQNLTAAQIEELIEAFAQAAQLAEQAGFAGVEIMGGNGFLLQQFVSRKTNTRTDQWGEPFAFINQVVTRVKARINSPHFILGYRFSPEEPGDNGMTMQEALALVENLAHLPLQYLHVSLWDFFKPARRGVAVPSLRIKLIHEQLQGRLPLIGVGNLINLEAINKASQSGYAEFFAFGKAAILNPDWVTKIYQQQELEQTLDLERKAYYGLPQGLWEQCLTQASYLPALKGEEPAVKLASLY
ncbi:NADH-dependent flavin oxidoreductase [Psittacicella gerlachiana]|uniref:oxidoreductase n=1 Tax=Psittacicella gerlachiana TaxID=2028574 RepID=UPI001CA7992A|nr:NADH-dependent flavin oxidoreductase [Psittacicella gerlachiana]